MDYSKMSDFEINLAVAHIAIGSGGYDWSSDKKEVYLAAMDGGEFLPNAYFNPCNNPADAWPIIVENNITIINDKNCFPRATNDSFLFINDQFDDCIHWCDRNPLKAAMIVFLMMQDSQNAKIPSERDS